MDYESFVALPDDDRAPLRACLKCTLLKTFHQFIDEGCDNCEDQLEFAGSQDRVEQCTTTDYVGQVAVINPQSSWVAKWQRLQDFKPGYYAIHVTGELPEEIAEKLRDAGAIVRAKPYAEVAKAGTQG
mmetsp:Transcript_5530/g.15439  ORF Transcript_5530/g.15439 Transcript_5530/m.15439 type:complete len:128 (-) Transcript_5530:249-632(-)|eukprot:CAMPEP_0118866098 /NCGR_PEP_ID=MMETSP1163-20130328/10097_1 /TAXON_ID=124430 /ORGANISM="Phaeomonas parva, Strain CCMP2877" /LENGTH=127 /DNA_ID=CAMNT_0006800387 /DNA_START=129 /DNA_END=512 /DNA_ORIENTATION=-